MNTWAYNITVLIVCLLAGYAVMSIADNAIERQDMICQEGGC